jgi:hypothetical protein
VHRVVERHRELEALPGLRIALVLVLHCESDRLAVDVLDRRHGVGHRVRAYAERDRERHGREHVRRVVLLVERLVADHRPARGLDHLDVQAVSCVEAHRVRHDDRRGAGDRDEADLQLLLFRLPGALRERLLRSRQREYARDRGKCATPTDQRENIAPYGGAQQRFFNRACFDVVLDLRAVLPARASVQGHGASRGELDANGLHHLCHRLRRCLYSIDASRRITTAVHRAGERPETVLTAD